MPNKLNGVLDIVASGDAILVLGDLGATSDGRASLRVMRDEALAELGLPDTTQTPTGRVMHALLARSPRTASRLLASHLTRSVADVSDLVRVLQAPWERIYSVAGLNLSNVDFDHLNHRVVHHRASLPQTKSAGETLLVDESPGADEQPSEFVADVDGASDRGFWRGEMRARTLSVPAIAIAIESDDELWDRLSSRSAQAPEGRAEAPELAPCVLILSRIRPEDTVMSLSTGVTLLEGTLRDLALTLLPGDMKMKHGHRLLARSRSAAIAGVGVQQVSALTKGLELPTSWDFLRGYDPSWADVFYKRPIRLSVLKRIRAAGALDRPRNTVVVRARSGAGKTTALMMFSHDLAKQGYSVAWLDRAATQPMQQLLDQVDDLDPDCVVIDDADIFGESTPKLLRLLGRQGDRLVIASVRTTRDRIIGYIPDAKYIDESPLTDPEIRALHDVLSDGGLLGSLQGVQPLSTRLEHLRELCQRDLLAALIEIVTGQRFEQRIQDEFQQLAPLERRAYQALAVFVAHVAQARALPKAELLQCLSYNSSLSASLTAIDSLLHQGLFVEDADGVRVRHRSIARALVEGLPRASVAGSLELFLRYYAARAHAINDPSDPQRRTMIALLSHSLMVALALPLDDVRHLYASAQGWLRNDFHFWLQRGAYETERGDDELARTYLNSARACPGGANDYKVITESGILALRRAHSTPTDAAAQDAARTAIHEMLEVTRTHGATTPHTFKVLAEDGPAFVDSCVTLSDTERKELMARLDDMVGIGLSVCQDNTVAMGALRAYSKRRGGITTTPAPLFPMPIVTAKPGPFRKRSRK